MNVVYSGLIWIERDWTRVVWKVFWFFFKWYDCRDGVVWYIFNEVFVSCLLDNWYSSFSEVGKDYSCYICIFVDTNIHFPILNMVIIYCFVISRICFVRLSSIDATLFSMNFSDIWSCIIRYWEGRFHTNENIILDFDAIRCAYVAHVSCLEIQTTCIY